MVPRLVVDRDPRSVRAAVDILWIFRGAAIDVLAAKYPQYVDRRPDGPVIAIHDLTWHHWSGL